MPILRILVKRDGSIIAEGFGYSDITCIRDLEKFIEMLRSLGVQVTVEEQKLKPEALRQGVATRA